MIIYSARLILTREATIQGVACAVAGWLGSKLVGRVDVDPRALLEPGDREIAPRQRIEVESLDGEPTLHSIRYSHPDAEVRGRTWITEVGLRQNHPAAELICSILLRTEEVSARIGQSHPVRETRPGVVEAILRRCRPSGRVPGFSIGQLDGDSAEAFEYHVRDPDRRHSIAIIGATAEGRYLVDPDRLQRLLLGLAEVVLVPREVNLPRIDRILDRSFYAWSGAVRLIHPTVYGSVPTKLIHPHFIEDLGARGIRPEQEILSLLLHRVNSNNARLHISRDEVRRARALRELELRRDVAQRSDDREDLRSYIKELEQQAADLKGEVAGLHEEVLNIGVQAELKDDRIEELQDENRQLAFQIQGWKERLASLPRSRNGDDQERLAGLARTIAGVIEHEPNPEECLTLVANLFPDRIVVLDSAWKAAKQSRSFQYRCDLYGLLNSLAGEYFEALSRGEPDAKARAIFGGRYAARESESVEVNIGARKRRTFEYNGRPVEMMKHLKIGTKDSAAETIRVHFEWLAEEKKIVIGYCGPHIPFH